ncbi:hypothetical protein F4604DRAFT_1679876 [Suillus subluteus]|nr:hypothetical protein F4604DRAFT_1679876 [Suillus subluteus]
MDDKQGRMKLLADSGPASGKVRLQGSARELLTMGITAMAMESPARLSSAGSAFTLCAHRWLKQIKTNGTTEEFGAYYMSLAENQHTAYDNEAADLVATDKWDKAVGQGKMN